MRYFSCVALVLFLFSSSASAVTLVHYFKRWSDNKGILYHSGTSGQEMHQSLFDQMETTGYIKDIRPCAFYPTAGHAGARNLGVWNGAVSKGGAWFLDQVHDGQLEWGQAGYYPPIEFLHEGVITAFCTACSGNQGVFVHVSCSVVVGSPADEAWLWNGSNLENDLLKNVTYTHDEAGNIDGYNYELNEGNLPFGAFFGDDNGQGGNGTIAINPITGPAWKWNDGVSPPIDPSVINNLASSIASITDLLSLNQASLSSMLASENMTADRVLAVSSALDLIYDRQSQFYVSQAVYNDLTASQFSSMNSSLSEIHSAVENIPAVGSGSGSSTNSTASDEAVLAELIKIEALLTGEEIMEETTGANSALVAGHDSMINALDIQGLRGRVEGLNASGLFLKDTVNSVFGSWRSLPRTVPDWSFDFEFPLAGKTFKWSWRSADSIPPHWWLYVQILRNAEVIGLAIWLLLSVSKLLHQTFGGAS